MAASGVIEFHASSGAPSHPFQLDRFVAGSGTEWNRLGFFGNTGPGSFVTVNNYQDTTFVVNESGTAVNIGVNTASGKLQNLKYVNSSTVNPNSSGAVAVNTLSRNDATFRVRFTEPSGTAVQTQNVMLRCVALNASSGVDNESAVVSGINVQAIEVGVSTTWEKLSDNASDNYISLSSRTSTAIVHDYHLGLSVSPITTGEKKNFAFLFKLEYI